MEYICKCKYKSFGILRTHSLTNSTLVGSAGGILTMGAAPGPGAGAGGGGGRIAATGVVATGAEGTAGAGGGATGIAPEKSKNSLIIMPDFAFWL